uniref:XK-related protein n=1 Tax=Cyprinus carpio TaxID=7962 RepID=A0A8C2PX39_CYPCA
MNCATFPKYSLLDFFFTLIGVCTFLFDVGSDLWVAKEFYTHGEFIWCGLFVGFMLISSVVIQLFSWFWLQYDRGLKDFESQASAGNVVLFSGAKRVKLLLFLHVFSSRECYKIFICPPPWFWWHSERDSLIGTMMTIFPPHQGRQDVSVGASTTSIAWMVVDYHRSLRSFLPDKDNQGWLSSVVYFFWNLFLIGPRVASVALFASVLPNFIAAHFLILWPVFVVWAWRQGTDFMDSPAGERLYRATIGLIWYFSWFNVAEGDTRDRSLIYHIFIITDTSILLTTWWFYRDTETTQSYAFSLIISIPLCYVLGLLIKVLYYCCFHPKLWRPADLGKTTYDVTDGVEPSVDVQTDSASDHAINKRMSGHAANFYTTNTSSTVKTKECETTNASVL